MTLNYDPKDGDAGPFGAVLSHRPEFYKNALVNVYPYNLPGASALINSFEEHGAAPGWKEKISFAPIPQIEGILGNDFLEYDFSDVAPKEKFNLVYQAALKWTESFFDEGLKVSAVNLSLAGIGEFYDIDLGTAVNAEGVPVPEPQLKKYFEDRIMIELFRHFEKNYPHVPRIGTVRSYDVAEGSKRYKWAPVDGKPAPWGVHHAFHNAMATPGLHLGKYKFHMYVADQIERCLAHQAWFDVGTTLPLSSDNPGANLVLANIQ